MNKLSRNNTFFLAESSVFIAFLVYAVGGFSSEQPVDENEKVRVINSTYEFDAEGGNKHEVILQVENKGGGDLVISNISPDCNCVLSHRKKIIALLGQKSNIPVFLGDQSSRIIVESNDLESPIRKFNVTV